MTQLLFYSCLLSINDTIIDDQCAFANVKYFFSLEPCYYGDGLSIAKMGESSVYERWLFSADISSTESVLRYGL